MGLFEGITHKEEIEELLEEAQSVYSNAEDEFNTQKDRTSKSLETLGKVKVEAWSKDINGFLGSFGNFQNIEMIYHENDKKIHFVGENETPDKMLVNMQMASMTAQEIAKTGALAIGTGALVGIASYGGAMMFAHASTGTAIAALHGAAKTNATLAWFGGGSKALGGLGVKGGKFVLGGIAVLSVLAVAGLITAVKAKERLAEAKETNAQAKKAAKDLEVMTEAMSGIETISNNYTSFVNSLSEKFQKLLSEMDRIAKDYPTSAGEKIDFNRLSDVEQKTLHISWLLAQVYYQALSMPILSEDGEIHPKAKAALKSANKDFDVVVKQIDDLEEEKESIKTALDDSRTIFTNAQKELSDSLRKFKKTTAHITKKRFSGLKHSNRFIEVISCFDDIDFRQGDNVFSEKLERDFSVTTSFRDINRSTLKNEIAFFGLESGETESDVDAFLLTGTQPAIELSNEIINTITGKESLAMAQSIYSSVANNVKTLNGAAQGINGYNNSGKKLCKQIGTAARNIKHATKILTKIKEKNLPDSTVVHFDALNSYNQERTIIACEEFDASYDIMALPLYSEDDTLKATMKALKSKLRKLKFREFKLSVSNLFKRKDSNKQ